MLHMDGDREDHDLKETWLSFFQTRSRRLQTGWPPILRLAFLSFTISLQRITKSINRAVT